jgi:hypothetical protein
MQHDYERKRLSPVPRWDEQVVGAATGFVAEPTLQRVVSGDGPFAFARGRATAVPGHLDAFVEAAA